MQDATQDRFRLSYHASLDGLRGVAVLMVMAYHASLVQAGFLGVDVFFVLSGFLITALLMQEWDRTGSISLRNFYTRRALRLLPALLVFLSLFLIVPGLFGLDRAHWKLALVILFYGANWAFTLWLGSGGMMSHTWSLSVEEQFYILWPPLLYLLLRRKAGRAWILGLVLSGAFGAWLLRLVLLQSRGPAAYPRLYYGLDTRLDSLLLGCTIGMLAAWSLLPRRRVSLLIAKYAAVPAGMFVLYMAFAGPSRESRSLYQSVESSICAAVAVLIVSLITSPPKLLSFILEQPVFVWLGQISYGLYLWHVPIFNAVLGDEHMAYVGVNGSAATLCRFAVSIAVAALSFYLIERPILSLKERFRGRIHNDVRISTGGEVLKSRAPLEE